MAAGVFISYRRSDSAYALLLYKALLAKFGRERVFRDFESIDPGQDFVAAIDGALSQCAACVVIIGKGWLESVERLAAAGDFVRREIEAALPRLLVIPCLVGGARMPAAAAVPPSLAPLLRRDAVTLGDDDQAPPQAAPTARPTTAAPQPLRPVGAEPISGWVSLTPVGWGTRLDLTCSYADDDGEGSTWSDGPPTYAMYVTRTDGSTERVASWRGLPGKTMHLAAATAGAMCTSPTTGAPATSRACSSVTMSVGPRMPRWASFSRAIARGVTN